MSEMPERKVLKEILLRLKARTLTAESQYRTASSSFLKIYEEAHERFVEDTKVEQDDPPEIVQLKLKLQDVLRIIYERFYGLFSLSINMCDDLKLYIDSLETYSTELDKTLTDIFEQAKKAAEEQIKQQEEIMKRKSPESYRI